MDERRIKIFSPQPPATLDLEIKKIYTQLGISEEDEKHSGKFEAAVLGQRRSFPNIRNSIRQYLEWRIQRGKTTSEEVLFELQTKVAEIKSTLVMAYYANFGNAKRVIDSGSLKNLFEFAGSEQDERKKAMEVSLDEALMKRRDVDEALGWQHPENVYHLAVEQVEEGHHPQGPGSNYGAIRFVFDYEKLADHSTFTEGDSLNPAQIPNALYEKKRGSSSSSKGVENRQISKEHVPIAKAIFNLATEHEQLPPNTAIFLRYIEAQVGEISGSELLNNLTGIEVDIEEGFREARSGRLLYNADKEKALYKQYYGKDPGEPNPFPDLSKPTERAVDFNKYYEELAELRWSNFIALIDSVKQFCDSKGIEFRQAGYIDKVKEAIFYLTKKTAF